MLLFLAFVLYFAAVACRRMSNSVAYDAWMTCNMVNLAQCSDDARTSLLATREKLHRQSDIWTYLYVALLVGAAISAFLFWM